MNGPAKDFSAFSRVTEKVRALAVRGIRRFLLPVLWSLALFFFASWAELADAEWEFKLHGTSVLLCGLSFSACLSLWWEKIKKFSRLPWLSLPLAALCWFAFGTKPVPAFYSLYGMGLSLSAFALGMYALRTKACGDALFSHVFCSGLKALGTALLTALSLVVCYTAADALLLDLPDEGYPIILYFSVFVVGADFFLAWLPENGEEICVPGAFLKLLRRLFVPMYLVLTAILLAYVLKIGAEGELPATEMTWYSSLAVLGYSFMYFSLCGTEDRMLRRFLRFAPLALLPVVAAHLLGMGLRVEAYGLTTQRYASLLCTSFGIVVMAFGFLRKKSRALYPLAAALLLLATVTPANILELPMRDQQYRLQTVLEKYGMMRDGEIVRGEPLTEEDRKILVSAYDYLRWDDTRVTDAFTAQISSSEILEEEARREDASESRHLLITNREKISVEGWKTLSVVHGEITDGNFKTENGTFPVEINWKEIFDAHAGELKTETPPSEDVDGTRRIIFSEVNLWKQADGRFTVTAEGYLLEK